MARMHIHVNLRRIACSVKEARRGTQLDAFDPHHSLSRFTNLLKFSYEDPPFADALASHVREQPRPLLDPGIADDLLHLASQLLLGHDPVHVGGSGGPRI